MGLIPEHLEPQPIALFRSFERFLRRREDNQTVSIIVDLGAEATRIIVGRGRRIVFIKSIDIGGRKLTEAIAKQLRLEFEEADELRRRVVTESLGPTERSGKANELVLASERGVSTAWAVRDAMRGEIESLARELSLCLRYCAVTFRGLRPKRILLTGGQAGDPAVAELLKEQLKVECEVAQPLRGINVSGADFGGDRRGLLADWAVCTGLALREVRAKDALRESDHGEHRLSA